jgi:hypothetical protein
MIIYLPIDSASCSSKESVGKTYFRLRIESTNEKLLIHSDTHPFANPRHRKHVGIIFIWRPPASDILRTLVGTVVSNTVPRKLRRTVRPYRRNRLSFLFHLVADQALLWQRYYKLLTEPDTGEHASRYLFFSTKRLMSTSSHE